MKITALLGSAKKKGNTATVLGWVRDELEALGHTVEVIYLNSKSINGCLGCAKCREKPDEIACVQHDDAIDILEKMISSDVVLYASPIYFWGYSAQIKALIDRSYSLVTNYHKPGHTSLMKDKPVGLLVTGADPYEITPKECLSPSTGSWTFCWRENPVNCMSATAAYRPTCRKKSKSRLWSWPVPWWFDFQMNIEPVEGRISRATI